MAFGGGAFIFGTSSWTSAAGDLCCGVARGGVDAGDWS